MRIDGKCCGDCGACELVKSGRVDMIPCVLDQIFQRVQRNEARMSAIEEAVKGGKEMAIALASIEPSVEPIKEEEL